MLNDDQIKKLIDANKKIIEINILLTNFELSLTGGDKEITDVQLTFRQTLQYANLLRREVKAMAYKHDLMEEIFKMDLSAVNVVSEYMIQNMMEANRKTQLLKPADIEVEYEADEKGFIDLDDILGNDDG